MPTKADRGETLIELLISISIIGITTAALLGAVMAASASSGYDRRVVRSQALLKSWGEVLTNQVAETGTVETGAARAYTPCADAATYEATPAWRYPPVLGPLPPGFTPSVVAVRYWNGTAFGPVCTLATDSGIQQVDLQMAVGEQLYPGFTTTYTIVVRRPCATVTAC